MAELTDHQSKAVWSLWLSAQIREGYFALLCRRYVVAQRWLTGGTLFLSSGALATVLSTKIPASWSGWMVPLLTALAAALSAVSLVARCERSAMECQDLHKRWLALAHDYERLWNDVDAPDASERLKALEDREEEISRTGAAMPQARGLLVQSQANVEMHHREALA